MTQSAVTFTGFRTQRGSVVGSANRQGLVLGAQRPASTWFVDTVNGSNSNVGGPFSPFQTMAKAFTVCSANDTIFFTGIVREQLVAPLVGADGNPLTGVAIIGNAVGGVRDDNAAKWTYPASGATAGQALLAITQQGWEVRNFLMTPEPTSGACIELRNTGDVSTGEGGHFVSEGMRYVGIDVTTTYGIRDLAGTGFNWIIGNQFFLLTTAIYGSGTGIAIPWGWQIRDNRFMNNTNHINMSARGALVANNYFMTEATINIDLVAVSAQGSENVVTGNTFKNLASDITPSDGWTGSATDQWTQNFATDAVVFGVPA